MPEFDGTGPSGAGPMTGRGRGYCILELPENEKLPEIVSDVLSEMRETSSHDSSPDEATQLTIRIRQMQFALRNLDRRIEILSNNRRQKNENSSYIHRPYA